ncbi:MAG: rhamnulokinase, partial [Clostridia bacterium]|nr:rhamnulokinase [Clostridia bacterium]
MVWHLAIDFGASSGRHILGGIENGKLLTQEIYRFDNKYINKNGTLCWDTEKLFSEIINGLKKCGECGKIPQTVAIDTWGVDFALLDADDRLCGDTVSYRDGRTEGIQDEVHAILDEQTLFERTGIQSHTFNTLYQLYALKKQQPEVLQKAKTLLFLPDYFAYLLTGKKYCERTIASTSEMINLKTGTWDGEILDALGIKKDILLPVSPSCTVVGRVKPEIEEKIGFAPTVILAASHDTGSAVVSVVSPEKNKMYISSGTWSLMGIESDIPFTSCKCREDGFSNEG